MTNKPIQTRSVVMLTNAAADQAEEQVEYVKEAVATFSIPVADVKYPREIGFSYDILWHIPGYNPTSGVPGNTQVDALVDGVLCDLHRSSYKIENLSPYTIFIRLQRPMGYKTDPSALGMWEPALHGKDQLLLPIKPHTHRNLSFSNGSTAFMQPRMQMHDGDACIHLASFSLYREPLTDFGTDPSGKANLMKLQDAITMTVITEYKANDGRVGKIGKYSVVSYAGDQRLNEVNTGPPPSVRISDLRLKGGVVELINFSIEASTKRIVVDFLDDKANTAQAVDGLDIDTIYMLPLYLEGKAEPPQADKANRKARYIRWYAANATNKSIEGWYVGDLEWARLEGNRLNFYPITGDVKNYPFNISNTSTLNMYGNEILRPVVNAPFAKVKLIRNRNGKPRARVVATTKGTSYHQLSDAPDGIFDMAITALVIITRVVKVGIEIAGMVGLLAVHPPAAAVSIARTTSE